MPRSLFGIEKPQFFIVYAGTGKKMGIYGVLPCRYDEGALSGGHELADGTTCELAARVGKVELQ